MHAGHYAPVSRGSGYRSREVAVGCKWVGGFAMAVPALWSNWLSLERAGQPSPMEIRSAVGRRVWNPGLLIHAIDVQDGGTYLGEWFAGTGRFASRYICGGSF